MFSIPFWKKKIFVLFCLRTIDTPNYTWINSLVFFFTTNFIRLQPTTTIAIKTENFLFTKFLKILFNRKPIRLLPTNELKPFKSTEFTLQLTNNLDDFMRDYFTSRFQSKSYIIHLCWLLLGYFLIGVCLWARIQRMIHRYYLIIMITICGFLLLLLLMLLLIYLFGLQEATLWLNEFACKVT